MSWFFKLIGSVTGNIAEVTTANELKVATEKDVSANAANVGASKIFSENDAGSITGDMYLKSPETSADYRLRVGMDTILFTDTFNASTQNTNNWAYTFATLTASQPGSGTLNFGTVQGTAATHGAFMRSFQYFPLIGTSPLAVEFTVGQFTAALTTNEEFRIGLALPTVAGTAPTNGVWMKITPSGIIGEMSYNGSLTGTGVMAAIGTMTVGELFKLTLVVGEGEVEFWKDDVLIGELLTPAANGQPFIGDSLPVFMQKLCSGAVSNTNTMRISDITVSQMDINTSKPWAHQMSLSGQSAYNGQNGHTQGKTSIWANNTAPTAVALTNTTAAFVGLGGVGAVLPTLTANNDGILFSYQNPASTANITGRNLIVTGVTLEGAVSVALTGGPVVYAQAIAYGHTNVSLATTETGSFVTATTHAPKIIPIGIGSYPATSAVGITGAGASLHLSAPIVVRPGEFIQIIMRNMGVVTSAGAITFVASFDAYFE